jgi:formylmethanofuran dehydrogenase subunit C
MITSKKNQRFLRLPPVTIKRDSFQGLDGMFGYTTDDVETQREITHICDPDMQRIYGECNSFLDYDVLSAVNSDIETVVLPSQINEFVQNGKIFSEHENYSNIFGIYISKLVKNSYDDGNNDFVLDLENVPLFDHLFLCLKGRGTKNDIDIIVNGNVGSNFAKSSMFLQVTLNGDADDSFGFNSNYLTAHIKGNVKDYFGIVSNHMHALIEGNVGDKLGNSFYSNFVVGGDVGDNFGYHTQELESVVRGKIGSNFLSCATDERVVVREDQVSPSLQKIDNIIVKGKTAMDLLYIKKYLEFEKRMQKKRGIRK